MPPMVARLDGRDIDRETTGPVDLSCRFSSSSTMPGSTMQVRGDRVDRDQPVQVLAEVHDQRPADGLAGLRGAAAARQQRHAFLARDGHRRAHVVVVLGTTTPTGSIW